MISQIVLLSSVVYQGYFRVSLTAACYISQLSLDPIRALSLDAKIECFKEHKVKEFTSQS
jgi:hypothetical protein